MVRRRQSEERKVKPDIRYNSVVVSRFINHMMLDGKRSIAETIFYDALDKISATKKDADPFKVFSEALRNVSPIMEVKGRRVGGATYQVPMEVRRNRSQSGDEMADSVFEYVRASRWLRNCQRNLWMLLRT